MDIRKFLNNTVLLLDLSQVSLDAIIDEILQKLLGDGENKASFDQARSALFTHDIGKVILPPTSEWISDSSCKKNVL